VVSFFYWDRISAYCDDSESYCEKRSMFTACYSTHNLKYKLLKHKGNKINSHDHDDTLPQPHVHGTRTSPPHPSDDPRHLS
jgi:hypothetical protein